MMEIRLFETAVTERTPEDMCAHAKSVVDVMNTIPVDERNSGDMIVGQLAENVQWLVHEVPLDALARHRESHGGRL